jgi:hypothetical protein
MTESSSNIRFDRAEYANEAQSPGPPCDFCRGPLGPQYWKWQTQVACAACRDRLAAALDQSRSARAFATAAAQGATAAFACGLGYALFVAVTRIQIAIATIGIGYVVARVLRRATQGVGGVRVQILAVLLTYVASSMAYAGDVLPDLRDALAQPAELLRGIGLMLSIPVLTATERPLTALIVGFGLWEAWKLSRGASATLEGPFRTGPVDAPFRVAAPPPETPPSP